jgi:hypothetical protein
LISKGFKSVEITKSEKEFIEKLPNYDSAWVISAHEFEGE